MQKAEDAGFSEKGVNIIFMSILKSIDPRIILLNSAAIIFLYALEIYNFNFDRGNNFLFENFLKNISYGIISSTIFYIIVVLTPREKKRKKLNSYFLVKKITIHNLIKRMLHNIIADSRVQIEDKHAQLKTPEKEKLKKMLDSIKLSDTVENELGLYGTWHNYIFIVSKEISSHINDTLEFSDLLDDELIKLLCDIDTLTSRRLGKSDGITPLTATRVSWDIFYKSTS